MHRTFHNCKSLKTLDVSNFDTSKVTNMYALFMYCTSLKELNLSNFDISSVTSISGIFSNLHSLQKLDIRNMDFTNVSKYEETGFMFNWMPNNTLIYVKDQAAKDFMIKKYEGSGTLTNIQIVNS